MGEAHAVEVQIIDDARDLLAIEAAWWELLGRAVHAQPTMTPAWLSSWWRVFGDTGGRELRVVAIRAGAELVALVPLLRRWVVRDRVFPVATLELLGSGEPVEDEICSELIGAVVAEGREKIAARAFAEALSGGDLGAWDELSLSAMNTADPVVPLLAEALSRRGAAVEIAETEVCPYIALPSSWDEYLAMLGREKRYFVRRTLRDLETWAGPGGMALRRAEDRRDLTRGFQILQGLHEERWGGPGAFRSERFRKFHDLVTHRLLHERRASLDLCWLEVRGEPVAVLYNVAHQGHVHFYQSGRRRDVPRGVRPGIGLHLMAIQRAITMGQRTYELLARADQYKHQISPGSERRLVTLSAVAPTMRARAVSGARRTARTLVNSAREVTRSCAALGGARGQ
ncbi:MAG: GNAT family N-acetyltransferase [Polyangiaceae bacterium]